MQNKELRFNGKAREALLEGMGVLADAVGSTLGPKGRCVIVDDYTDDKPLITKDGVTVARSIQLKDKFKNLGVQLLREASTKTVEMAGDGTTTSVVLAYELIRFANEMLEDGWNPITLKNELKPLLDEIVQNIKDQAIPIKTEDIEKVATISSNNDTEIGKLIAEAFQKIGRDGVITVQESPSIWTYTEVITGMQFERGMESEFFATDPIRQICELEDAYVFITEHKIQLMRDIVPVLEIVAKKRKPILIIAQDYDDEVIQNLKLNVMRGIIKCCAVKAPSYANYRKFILEDLAILTGATVVTFDSGIELPKVTEQMLGRCGKFITTKETTTIIDGKGNDDAIKARAEQIREQMKNVADVLDADFLKEFHAQRLARLTGGICSIYVGGTTELEMKERKDRIDDAVCATKAAIEEGIVPGGGMSFVKAYQKFKETHPINKGDDPGVAYVLCGLFSVRDQILDNAGIDSYTVDLKFNGFDAQKMEWCDDMIERGIINPAKSDRLALENAISVLYLYLSSSCLIIKEEVSF